MDRLLAIERLDALGKAAAILEYPLPREPDEATCQQGARAIDALLVRVAKGRATDSRSSSCTASPATTPRGRLIGGETRLPACYVRQNHACLQHDTLDELHRIACPTLILAGGRDQGVLSDWLRRHVP